MPTEAELAAYAADMEKMQAQYEAAMGIPATGRTRFQDWQANQWRTSAMRWALGQSGLMGDQPDLEYSDWLDVSPQSGYPITNLNPVWAARMGNLNTQQQMEYLERLPGGLRPYAQQEMFRGAIGGPRFMRQNVTAQAFGEPMQRAWEVSPQGEEAGATYLDWLRRKYNF